MNILIYIFSFIAILLIGIIASRNLFVFLVLFAVLSNLPLLYDRSVRILNYARELIAIISLIVIFFRLYNGYYNNIFNVKFGKLLFWFVISFWMIVLLSLIRFGFEELKWHRLHYYSVLFLVGFASYRNNKYNRESFYRFLQVLVVIVVIQYFLRVFNVLPMPIEGGTGYLTLRFITNGQTLFLLMFYIYISRSKYFNYKITIFDNILFIFSFYLIITSTQRMITFIFVLYLFYDLLTNPRLNILLYYSFGLVGLVLFLLFNPTNLLNTYLMAFLDIFNNFQHSNAYGKIIDVIASTQHLIKENKLIFGTLFQNTVFDRSFAGFSSKASRGIHNLYVTYLVRGGVFLFSPLIILIFSILKEKYQSMIRNYNKFYDQVAFLFVICVFLFANTSGAAWHNAIAIGYSILITRTDSSLVYG